MTVSIQPLIASSISDLISFAASGKLEGKQLEMIEWCQSMSGEVWTGWVDDELVCIWGLITPTLISRQAYLWMYSTSAVQEHKFLFVRHSQRVIEQMLNRYESIVGHCLVGAKDSIRWVRWLGGVFDEANGPFMPFKIEAKHG